MKTKTENQNQICMNCGHTKGFHFTLNNGKECCLRGKIAGIQNKISCSCKKFIPKNHSQEFVPIKNISESKTGYISLDTNSPSQQTSVVNREIVHTKKISDVGENPALDTQTPQKKVVNDIENRNSQKPAEKPLSERIKELEHDTKFVDFLAGDKFLREKDVAQTFKQIEEDIDNAQENCANLDWISKEQAIKILHKRTGKLK